MKKTIAYRKLNKGLTVDKPGMLPEYAQDILDTISEEIKELAKEFEKGNAGETFDLHISFGKRETKKVLTTKKRKNVKK